MNRGACHPSAALPADRLFSVLVRKAALFALPLLGAVLFAAMQPARAGVLVADASAAGQPAMRIWSPEILSGADRELYRKIFDATERGRFAEADKLAAQLKDRRLMGYVLQAKYMGAHYRTSYAELRDWLAKYNDLPGAADIHKLALKRRPASAAMPERPVQRRWRQPVHAAYAVDDGMTGNPSPRFREIDNEIRRMVRDGKADTAHAYLKRRNIGAALTGTELDRIRERIVASYFLEGEDNKAYLLANEILQNHAREVPLADWYAGLAAWRMDAYGNAARHFERLARSATVSNWSKAAGGFWAARAWLADGAPEKVAPLLELAADTGPTFYGILATRQLGRDLQIDWVEPRLDEKSFRLLTENDAVARAVALVQIGRRDMAREELVRAHAHIDPSLDQALIALAIAYDLPAVQLQVANAAHLPAQGAKRGRISLNAGLFPVPDYKPSNGYKVDRALLLAFMRQESKFQPDAMSWAGARGLMQIMPATASHITRDNSLALANKDRLLDPTFNITLGQEYLAELMGAGEPYGNLFMLTTAYNGGPGNLNRWLASMDFKGDPFLFIESIPAAETRGYIERVVTNYWIYSERLGQPVGSLDASASGTWPVYESAVGSIR
ncbi:MULTISPECIES: lytic transglycosylase domain-containing protein [Alphaproteobacteria]|uniref:lytic transglycosylase domain-containing protein n=1 Tax=Alphaproteobacteria TaxID=28211 RepID=UPI002730A9E0|nr:MULTISPECIES: lytic transglycosylase domain-containing protein [Alphaproteobacteria]MDP1626778.1 lytic transglycosylase domain-containing protein [Parvibaculum sp.]MDP2213794.1 lytic transglycosylase domain-containing protein [Phenylobacterium sp.]MDP3329759.1 lytic transglycosylase domain-containing protein [Parvibaculum sp.]